MQDLNLGYYRLANNYGYYIDTAPQEVLNELKIQIDQIQNNFDKGWKVNNELAGEIEHEYGLPVDQNLQVTNEYIKTIANKLEENSQFIEKNYKPQPPLAFDYLWVNFQKKYEYNPIHQHDGIFSFVIWYQIPYTFEDELKYNYKPNLDDCLHGKFTFVYPEVFHAFDKIKGDTLPIDKSKEGYIAIFPSNLHHVVYPFYSSDDYRITVAGNIVVKQN